MGRLIPVDFTALGTAEWAWLVLALGGLSLALPQGRWRRRGAFWTALVLLLLAFVRLLVTEEGSTWVRWGPVLVVPAAGAALVLLGALRPRLEKLARNRLWMPWTAALVLLSLLARPFGVARAADWLFLALLGFFLVALSDRGGLAGRLCARRVAGRVRGWHVAAAAWLGLCGAVAPFGATWVTGLGVLFLLALVYAVLAQGPQMRRYVVRRLVGAPVVLVLLLALSFVMMRYAPGGPFTKEKSIAPEVIEVLRKQYGLDQPLHVQFGRYMANLLWQGDLGQSTKQIHRSVNQIIANHAGPSARLGLAAMVLALLVGVSAGLISGIRPNSFFDYASMTGAMIGLALPTFVVGPMLVLVFALKLPWFHVAGWEDFPRDLVLPAITLSLPFSARVARLTRAGMLEIVNQDYIRTARAKGLSERAIVLRHTLKGALLPVVSFLGPAVALLLTGSLVVETIFGVPGLGVEFVQSALNRDYSLAMGLVVLFGSLLIGFNLVVDIAYGFLDPRIRHV